MVEKLYTVPESAKKLRISVPTIRAWVAQGRIKPVRLGRRVLFTEGQLQKIIDAGKPDGE